MKKGRPKDSGEEDGRDLFSWAAEEKDMTLPAVPISELPDICRNYHGGDPESEEANLVAIDFKARDRGRIIAYVQLCRWEGATCDEIEVVLGLAHQTASARCSELKKEGSLVRKTRDDKTVRRETRHGAYAAVLVRPAYLDRYGGKSNEPDN